MTLDKMEGSKMNNLGCRAAAFLFLFVLMGCQDARYVGGYIIGVPVEGIIVVQDVNSGELYHGTTTIPGTLAASIEINSFKDPNLKCSGRAEIVKTSGIGKGALGKARLLCTDARIVTAEFTYESFSSGFGVGVDTRKGVYRFVFGYQADGIQQARELVKKNLSENRFHRGTPQGQEAGTKNVGDMVSAVGKFKMNFNAKTGVVSWKTGVVS